VAKDWWHTRPDDRGPYFAPIAWEQSPKIKAFIEANLASFDPARQTTLLEELKRNRLDPKELQLRTQAQASLALLELKGANIEAIAGIAKANATLAERIKAFDALAKVPSPAITRAQLGVLDHWASNASAEPLLLQKRTEYLYATQHIKSLAELERLSSALPPRQQAMVWTIIVNLQNSPLIDSALKPQLQAIIAKNQNSPALISAQENLAKSKAGTSIGELAVDEAIKLVVKTTGDAKHGEELYKRQGCIACHAITLNEVPKGPFLGGVGNTFDRRYLAESMLNPSAIVAQGFQTQWLKLANGQHHEGFVTAELDGVIQLRNIAGVETKINAKDVAERGKRQESIMPPGLAASLTVAEFASLLDYLQSLKAPR
jgi:putative heme-binding domain-containing protein